MTPGPPLFSLSKWYLDCVTDVGDTSIAYTGDVTWGAFRLHYTSLLESEGSHIRECHSLRKQRPPQTKNGCVYWETNALQTGGKWRVDSSKPKDIGIKKTIFHSPEGSIEWHCLATNAFARVGKRSGLGYAEHLKMTIPPWKLPIQCLRWGRFTSHSHWIVWIDWRGEKIYPFFFIICRFCLKSKSFYGNLLCDFYLPPAFTTLTSNFERSPQGFACGSRICLYEFSTTYKLPSNFTPS